MTSFDDALLRSFLHHEDEYLSDDHDDDPDDDHDEEVPRTPLALLPAQRAALARAVDTGLREHGCDNTLRTAEGWAGREKVPWGPLRLALEERGGFCDCEVLLNVLEPPD